MRARNSDAAVKNFVARQGDVLITQLSIDTVPPGAKAIARDNGRVILAYGEVTGHAHAFYGPKVVMFREDGGAGGSGRRFITVDGDHAGPLAPATLVKDEPDAFLAQTRLGLVKFPKSHAFFAAGAVEIGPFSLLKHEEHDAHAIPAGTHEIGQQREYSPEEIRNVAD